MGISVASVIQYLRTRVGEGAIRFSDIYFAIPKKERALLQQAADEFSNDERLRFLKKHGLTTEELALFTSLRNRRTFAGDLYEYVTDTELIAHRLVRDVLTRRFGDGERGWWREGISGELRKKCAARREEDDDFADAFCYPNLIDLVKIIEDRWQLFAKLLPPKYASNRKSLRSDFDRLNKIRNAVMHPVKERRWSEADFQFVKDMNAAFRRSAERSKLPIPSLEPISEGAPEKDTASNAPNIGTDVTPDPRRIH
jgi:hypothetical protein